MSSRGSPSELAEPMEVMDAEDPWEVGEAGESGVERPEGASWSSVRTAERCTFTCVRRSPSTDVYLSADESKKRPSSSGSSLAGCALGPAQSSSPSVGESGRLSGLASSNVTLFFRVDDELERIADGSLSSNSDGVGLESRVEAVEARELTELMGECVDVEAVEEDAREARRREASSVEMRDAARV